MSVQVLGSCLRPAYSQLKMTVERDDDEVVRLRAGAALGRLDNVMREALFAKPSLTKTIYVLDPPA